MLSEDLPRTTDQLQAKLEDDAIDMGTAGKDNLYGSGRLNLVPSPTQPLRSYWQFNEGSDPTASDLSGNGNDGTIHGASWTTSVDGSGALSFDMVDDYVEVANAGSLNPGSELTIEAWIQPAASLKHRVIVEKPYTSHRTTSTSLLQDETTRCGLILH